MVSRSTLKELQGALARVERERHDAAQHLAELEQAAEYLRGVIAYFSTADAEPETLSQPAKTVRNVMVEILKDAGEPLHYKVLYERLLARNVEVNGKDPARTVGAHLSNDSRFKPLGAGVWWLASLPVPEKPDVPAAAVSHTHGDRVLASNGHGHRLQAAAPSASSYDWDGRPARTSDPIGDDERDDEEPPADELVPSFGSGDGLEREPRRIGGFGMFGGANADEEEPPADHDYVPANYRDDGTDLDDVPF